jgi:hypothetical protein
MRCSTLSTDGIAIEGMPYAPLEEALRLPVVRPEIERRMAKVRQIHDAQADSGEARGRLINAIDDLGQQLASLEALAIRGRERSRELGALLADGRDAGECLAAMDEIDEAILALSARSIAGFLIQSVIHGIVGEGEKQSAPSEIVSRSQAMYAGIVESASWQRGLLEQAAAALPTP